MKDQGFQNNTMQQPVYGAQIYPMPADAVNTTAKIQYGSRVEDSYYEPKRQLLGYSVFVVVATVAALYALAVRWQHSVKTMRIKVFLP